MDINKEIIDDIERIKEPEGMTKHLIYDVIFKAVFDQNRDILIKMIKDIFEIDDNNILNPLTVVGYETVPITENGKTLRSDIVVSLSDNSIVCVEMNQSESTDIIDRNIIQMIRVHNSVLKRGTKYKDLKKYRMRGLNFNLIHNVTGEPIENYAFCNMKTGKVASLIYSFCNIDLEMCHNLVYDIDIRNLPKAVRWSAILVESEIDNIVKILGDDILSMEEKDRLVETIKDVNNDKKILKKWIAMEKAKMVYENDIEYAKERGIKEGIELGREEGSKIKELEVIKNMLCKGYDYIAISDVTSKTIDEIKEIANTCL